MPGRRVLSLCLAGLALMACEAPELPRAQDFGDWTVENTQDRASARFVGRDGAADASADLANGSPAALFGYEFYGRTPERRTVAFRGCESSRTYGMAYRDLPEVVGGEGPPNDAPYAREAFEYAIAYNTEMYRIRRQDIESACPDIEPQVNPYDTLGLDFPHP